MKNDFYDNIEKKIEKIKKRNWYRFLRKIDKYESPYIYMEGKKYINFSSNDYLGLGSERENIKYSGLSASRLVSGNYYKYEILEKETASFIGKEASLVFGSGYLTNIGIISSIVNKFDCIFADEFAHRSIIDGMRLSGADIIFYKHNNIADLKNKIEKNRKKYNQLFIITESVFSMDGDTPDFKKIIQLKKRYKCILIVDEAHAIGVIGREGEGILKSHNLSKDVDIIIGTFSKSFGLYGGFAGMNTLLKEYFINRAQTLIYSTALPAGFIDMIIKRIAIMKRQTSKRKRIKENINYLRKKLKSIGIDIKNMSYIVPLIIDKKKDILQMNEYFLERGIYCIAIRYPTVPKDKQRFRISLTAKHTKKHLDYLVETIKQIF